MANILGINTGSISWAETTRIISNFYNDGKSHLLVTPNPEIILKALNDEELFYILNKADLSLADGFGLKLAAKFSGQKLYRATGADLLPHLLSEAQSSKRRVLIVNRRDGLSTADDISKTLSENYPLLAAKVIDCGQVDKPSKESIELIKIFKPALAICLLGSPYQEKYTYHLSASLPDISLLTGLGGSFDFLTGKIRRAAPLLRKIGLEWLWRLVQQPSRWRRIWRATAVFIFQFFRWLLILPCLYRPNVAILMFRQGSREREVLIVERQGQPGHWQLPQGGLDGLDVLTGGLKELKEETGASNVSVKGVFKNLYKYSFNKERGRYFNLNNQRHFGYKGQRQSLLIVEFLGQEEDIKINHWDHQAWRFVAESRLVESLHPCRREACNIYIRKLTAIK